MSDNNGHYCTNCTLNVHYVVCRNCYNQYDYQLDKCPKCAEPIVRACPRCWTSF
ncbi:MAG: hypothetical protein MJZ68_02705 [archaeon]|nr:hypothetical protein [archaeon]